MLKAYFLSPGMPATLLMPTLPSETLHATTVRHALPRARLLFLLAFALVLLPFCFLGYGSDNDTYGVLEAGRSTWLKHHLATSRHPGYWLYEAVVFVLSQLGGYLLSNLGSLAIATLTLWRLLVLSARLGARYPILLACCVAASPVFIVAATSTDDYLWSLLFLVLFAEALASDRPWRAMLCAAIAIAFRAANGILVAGGFAAVLVEELLRHRSITTRAQKLAAAGMLSAVIGGLPLLLSAYLVHWTLVFTEGYIGPAAMWTIKMRAGRVVYKGIYLFGPVATAILACTWITQSGSSQDSISHRLHDSTTRPYFIVILGILAGNALLFWRYPIEVSYIIPVSLFLFLLLGTSIFANAPRTLAILAISIFSLNVILFEFAAPNIPGMATGARFHFAVTVGTMVQDVRDRLPVRNCTTNDCWILRGSLPGH